MPYIVHADSGVLREGTVHLRKVTRFAAVETALGLIEQGIVGVTIVDGEGRVYTDLEFPDFLREGS